MKKSIQFIYKIDNLQQLTNYCESDMVVAGKDYPPADTPPWAEIQTKTETFRMIEGQYVTKTKTGYIIK